MRFLRSLCLPVLGAALLALPAAAQTSPKAKATRPAATRSVPNTSRAARAADPLRGTNNNGSGNNGYAAPGEPVNVNSNGKNTPSYDGPAPTGAARTKTTLAQPK
jgi:hypothetical protein